jgi:hypothetical protein
MMDKPVAIFNEAGFRLLLEALTGGRNVENDVENAAVDRFVKQYYAQNGEVREKRYYALNEHYDAVTKVFKANGCLPMKLSEIAAEVVNYGVDWDSNNGSNVMIKLVERYPTIEKMGYGVYAYKPGLEPTQTNFEESEPVDGGHDE